LLITFSNHIFFRMTPRVSILMPVYNNGDYVAEAIESMLCQTFTDFELIVLDDCSTDHLCDVITCLSCDSFVNYTKKIKKT